MWRKIVKNKKLDIAYVQLRKGAVAKTVMVYEKQGIQGELLDEFGFMDFKAKTEVGESGENLHPQAEI